MKMNKRIRKKKMTQKRNKSRKQILSMPEGIDKDRMLMSHIIRFGDAKFFNEVIGPESYIVMPRGVGRSLCYDVVGWLSADDVFDRIKNHYDSNKEVEK